MAKKPRQQAMRERAAKTAAVMATPGGAVAAPKKTTSPSDWARSLPRFAREVRAEARKITWTSRRETWITSVMVAIMVILAAIFFWATNTIISLAMNWILKVASGA
jgi:preprotein translocase subunit SecE